ncbi:MAG: PilZ domain-containing protein [Cyanobium sp. ELA507]
MLDLFRPQPQAPSASPKGRIARQSKRFSVPVLDLPIRVEVLVGGIRYAGQLWDVSQHGACLLLRSPIPPNQAALLRIHAPSDSEKIDIAGQLMWLDSVMGSYYAGVRYNQPVDFGPTFLGPLMRNAETFHRAGASASAA